MRPTLRTATSHSISECQATLNPRPSHLPTARLCTRVATVSVAGSRVAACRPAIAAVPAHARAGAEACLFARNGALACAYAHVSMQVCLIGRHCRPGPPTVRRTKAHRPQVAVVVRHLELGRGLADAPAHEGLAVLRTRLVRPVHRLGLGRPGFPGTPRPLAARRSVGGGPTADVRPRARTSPPHIAPRTRTVPWARAAAQSR